MVRRLRPQATTHVYRRVVTLAGEQAQVDWGTFGTVRIGHGTRAVSGFVMVLGYSRALFALFTLDQTLESFLRGHVAAFEALGGSARTLVYDNLRSAVLDRRGTAIQFHPRLLELAGHYHFAPRPCTPARGNENAYAERFVRSIKEECLTRVVPLGERHLRCLVREYVAHYHRERNHQGLDNQLLQRPPPPVRPDADVRRRERLGGLLNFYHREAA